MKRIILLSMFAISTVSFLNAQDAYVYDLQPDVYLTKEVVLKGSNAIEELKLTMGLKWMQKENQLQLTFDRKTTEGNDAYFLFFPLVYKKAFINDIADCKSQKKPLWSKGEALDYLHYFLESDNLSITDYKNCYKSLANNNEEEFSFEIKNIDDFTINLNGIYVAKTVKKPWYFFSSRDKKLEYIIDPVTLTIRFPQKKQTVQCSDSEQVIAYINAQKQIMKEDHDDLTDAQRNQNCTLFSLLKDIIRRKFVETNDKCEKYAAACEEIAQAIKGYNDEFETILNAQCTSSVSVSSSDCGLNEKELTAINNRLLNLQMKINLKKKEGGSLDSEIKEYQSIKIAINAKLTPECRARYKSLIDAFGSYCIKIEGLF